MAFKLIKKNHVENSQYITIDFYVIIIYIKTNYQKKYKQLRV